MLDWRRLTELSDAELGRQDVAAVNLACAVGLPGAEAIDHDGCLAHLDRWAVGVGRQTEGARNLFDADPARYDGSEAVFCIARMVAMLQKLCGVRYNPAKVDARPTDPSDLADEFVHGAIQGPGGTCATLPVLYAAVGRRLGYPIRLVRTRLHLFNRWDDPATGERVNFDGSTDGVNFLPDEHYRRWPAPMSPEQERRCGFLQSLTPRQELADFVGRRGFRLLDAGRYEEAVRLMVRAADLHPESDGWSATAEQVSRAWDADLKRRLPPAFPVLRAAFDPNLRELPTVPWWFEQRVRFLRLAERVLADPWHDEWFWSKLRASGGPHRDVPTRIMVHGQEVEPCTTL